MRRRLRGRPTRRCSRSRATATATRTTSSPRADGSSIHPLVTGVWTDENPAGCPRRPAPSDRRPERRGPWTRGCPSCAACWARCPHLRSAQAVLEWDQLVKMPPPGAAVRAHRLETLERIATSSSPTRSATPRRAGAPRGFAPVRLRRRQPDPRRPPRLGEGAPGPDGAGRGERSPSEGRRPGPRRGPTTTSPRSAPGSSGTSS